MSLWGNKDYDSGNNKPVYANTSPTSSNSTINGTKANTAKYYGYTWGVSATEAANTFADGPKITHAGWVSQKIGTGPIKTIVISDGGSGYNSGGFLTITGGGGANANISYAIANSQNTLESYSTNSAWNTISSLTIVNGGDGFSTVPTVKALGANTTPASFTVTLGGRAGRKSYETLVAMGSMTEDNSADDTYFPGT